MTFSILIANYNNGRFFKDCYNSILEQTYTDWEVIIVDDASTDDSVETIERFIKDDDRFHLFKNEINNGCGFTKRKCAEEARGKFCGFLDPDDALLPCALEEMVNAFGKNPDAVLIHSNLYICSEKLERKGLHPAAGLVKDIGDYYFNYAPPYNNAGPVVAFTAFLKSAYLETDGIDPHMLRAVDQDLYLKLWEIGSFSYLDKPLYLYRIHEGGISHPNKGGRAYYWHWYATIQAAKRRNLNIEDMFTDTFISKSKYDRLLKSITNSEFHKLSKIFAPVKGALRNLGLFSNAKRKK